MAGWVCRGLADIPDEVANSRAFAALPVHRFADVIRHFPAPADGPAAGFTRFVWRDWLANYHTYAWTAEMVPASQANSIEYYMLDSASNSAPIQLVGVNRLRPAPFGTWGYSFRNFRIPNTNRFRFSDYDEAMAIVRNDPIVTSSPKRIIIGKPDGGTRNARHWATNARPTTVSLPADLVLTQNQGGTRALFPLEALNYVNRVLAQDPSAFGKPSQPWTSPDTSAQAVRPPTLTPGRPGGSKRAAAQHATAAIHDIAKEEMAATPPPTVPSPARSLSRQRAPRQSPTAGDPGLDYTHISTVSPTGASRPPADIANDVAIQVLQRLPVGCPDSSWGTRNRFQRMLLDAVTAQTFAPPTPVNSLPAVEQLGAAIPYVARFDSSIAATMAAILISLLTGTDVPGQPQPPEPPAGGGRRGGRGPSGRGSGRGASPKSPKPYSQPPPRASTPPGNKSSKRPRTGGEQQESEHEERHRRSSRDSHRDRRRRDRSPSPRRSRRDSPPSLRERSPRPYRGRSPERRRGTPPPDRYRHPSEERRHQLAMRELHHAAAEKETQAAERRAAAAAARRLDSRTVDRMVRHHVGPGVRRGDYDPPQETFPLPEAPERPPARSPSPMVAYDRSPSRDPTPTPTITDYFADVKKRWPDGLTTIEGAPLPNATAADAPPKSPNLAAIRDASYTLPKKPPVVAATATPTHRRRLPQRTRYPLFWHLCQPTLQSSLLRQSWRFRRPRRCRHRPPCRPRRQLRHPTKWVRNRLTTTPSPRTRGPHSSRHRHLHLPSPSPEVRLPPLTSLVPRRSRLKLPHHIHLSSRRSTPPANPRVVPFLRRQSSWILPASRLSPPRLIKPSSRRQGLR